MSFNDDLLDLCRLNQLEEKNTDPETQKAIDWKKRCLMDNMRMDNMKFAPETEADSKDDISKDNLSKGISDGKILKE